MDVAEEFRELLWRGACHKCKKRIRWHLTTDGEEQIYMATCCGFGYTLWNSRFTVVILRDNQV